MGAPLGGPDVTEARARAAVAAVSPAFEICSKRLPAGLPRSVRIGNDLNNWGIVVGPAHSTDVALDELAVELFRDGELIDSGHSRQDVIDSPYLSLARVCRTLAEHGLSLSAGQRLITGSLLAGTPVAGATRFTARFGELGEVTVTVRS
jgi:2-keto-4-pentenoate hydratase